MPGSDIRVVTVGQMAVINGTVASPQDSAQAEMLVRSLLNPGIKEGDALKILPVNRLRTAEGLDRLRLVGPDPALDRGTAVAVGKNFGRRFYAEIITDGQGYSATEVEFRVTSWLSLLASVSTIGRESVRAEISRDY